MINRYSITSLIAAMLLPCLVYSQAYGIKAGAGIAMQRWSQGSVSPIITPHADLYIASDVSDGSSSLYAELGFHTRGSSLQSNFLRGYNYKFYNIGLGIGGRRTFLLTETLDMYQAVGVRAEYNAGHSIVLDRNTPGFSVQLIPEYINKFTYGLSVSSGLELLVGDNKAVFEVQLALDLSNQYSQDFPLEFDNPGSQSRYVIPARNVKNITIELKLGYLIVEKK